MKEKWLLSVSFLISTIGLAIISIMGQIAAPLPVDIGSLDFDQVGYDVLVQGEIKEINYHKDGHMFLTLGDETGTILVPIFNNLAGGLGTSLDDCKEVKVKGEVEEFRNELEVIPGKPGDIVCLKY